MIKDSIYTFITRIFYIIGKIFLSVIINRTLGATGKGFYELIQLTPNILSMFGTFGFNHANTYFAGRKPDGVPNLISNSYRLVSIFSIIAIVLGVGFLLLPVNQGMFNTVPIWIGFLALAVIPISILDLYLEATLYGENRIWVRNLHEFLRVVSGILLMVVLLVFLRLNVVGAVYGYILVAAVLLVFTIVVISRFHKIKGGGFDTKLMKECWQFGRFSWGADFTSYLLLNVDKWLLFLLLPVESRMYQVGLYATAVNVIVNIWIIPGSIQTALIPKITQKGEPERKKLVPPSLRIVTLMVLLAMGAIALIGKPALDILYNNPNNPGDFTEAYIPMMLLMPGIFAMSLAKVFTADFFSRGKPFYAMWVSILSLTVNVIINLILIPCDWKLGSFPVGGMNGAAIASSIAYTISFFVFLYFYIRESGEKSRDIFLLKKEDFVLFWSWIRNAWDNSGAKDADDEGEES